MPEMTVSVRWPDGRGADLYSPSLVMHDHLSPGTTYTVDEFVTRAATALGIASDRVRAKYGFACTSAAATLEEIRRETAPFAAADTVQVLRMLPPLPEEKP
ncbi:MAG: MSMEG_0570 family nitrogen starvation response protein [Actinomycetales bacterium]|nr:MAG: MSMEG_0570 family nitrogen starvation response protein [Actinomycetales bacterium]